MSDILATAVEVGVGVIVTGGLVALGPKTWRAAVARRDAKIQADQRTNEMLAQILRAVADIGEDVRCLYEVQAPQLEALEISLRLLKQEHVNGEATTALAEVRKAKAKVLKRLTAGVGCSDLGAA